MTKQKIIEANPNLLLKQAKKIDVAVCYFTFIKKICANLKMNLVIQRQIRKYQLLMLLSNHETRFLIQLIITL